MNLHDFYYELPKELIAQDPLLDRAGSRLLLLDRKAKKTEHHICHGELILDHRLWSATAYQTFHAHYISQHNCLVWPQ